MVTTDGQYLKAYVEQAGLKPVFLYSAMGMSKQNYYQLYKSKKFESDTIKAIEKATGAKWSEITKVNIDHSLPSSNHQRFDERESLVRTLENMAEDKIRSTVIIERLVTILEDSFNLTRQKIMPVQSVGPGTNVVPSHSAQSLDRRKKNDAQKGK